MKRTTNQSRRKNHLANETSPYLLQHVHNPVDWYPWGEEALRRARTEAKPIFLSIGYSACHWCHVMERESFEDPDAARILNAGFVCIKVDREERPDLDEIYITAVQLMTGSGGWPLTVFLTPGLKPFFGGTYFPPQDGFGRPGLKKLAARIASAWSQNQEDIERSADEVAGMIRRSVASGSSLPDSLDAALLPHAAERLRTAYDSRWGGFGSAPKFPPSGAIGVLLRRYARTGDSTLLDMATHTLDRMAYGGMYDQIGGGFHRYSTDERWLVPHFEKMLYDNALLARAYLEAWQVSHKDLYRRVAAETLDYVLREQTGPHGGFFSALDADSEGSEGKFYVWTPDEVEDALGEEDGALFCEFYGVTEAGNFEGRNIPNVTRDAADFAAAGGLDRKSLDERLLRCRLRLRARRDGRVRPPTDDKVITAWNGMMISALSRGYQALGETRFLEAARRAGDFVLKELYRDGKLLHTFRGTKPGKSGVGKIPAYLDDYAEMANGLVDLYEATFELSWLEAADRLAQTVITDFYDVDNEGFFFSSNDHKDLLARTKPYFDGAVPSGNATAALALLRLSRLLDKPEYYDKGGAVLRSAADRMRAQPEGHANTLIAADFYLYPTTEIGIAGAAGDVSTKRMLDIVHGRFLPNKIVALVDPDSPDSEAAQKRLPLLAGKSRLSGATTVYVCRDYSCDSPAVDEEALKKVLDRAGAVDDTTSAGR